MPKVVCIIPTNNQRPDELLKVLEHLKQFNFSRVLVVADTGKMLYNRYIQDIAEDEIIYTQDDDCIVYNIQELIDLYNPEKIIANCKPAYQRVYDEISDGKICLVGYGAVFSPKLIDFTPYLSKYPEDKLFYREADRIFTWLNKKELIVGDIEDFPSAEHGMSQTEEHFRTRDEIIKRLKTIC
jgi:hypothetical protein